MDAIALGSQADPNEPDAVVRPWRELELLIDVHTAQIERRVIVIDGVVGNGADFEFTCRGRTLTTAYVAG
jgi:hypothetical protein